MGPQKGPKGTLRMGKYFPLYDITFLYYPNSKKLNIEFLFCASKRRSCGRTISIIKDMVSENLIHSFINKYLLGVNPVPGTVLAINQGTKQSHSLSSYLEGSEMSKDKQGTGETSNKVPQEDLNGYTLPFLHGTVDSRLRVEAVTQPRSTHGWQLRNHVPAPPNSSHFVCRTLSCTT